MLTKENIVKALMQDDVIVQSYVYSYKSKNYWEIKKPVEVELSNGEVITIPEGFYYDMATVPKWLWSIVRPYNDGLFGYLVHDYLYLNKHKHSLNRKKADQEMLFWTNITNSNKFDNYIRYAFVRLFGWLWWKNVV